MITGEHAKRKLKDGGWTYRSAAPVLGVSFVHLAYVLNGQRASRRLLARVMALPARAVVEAGKEGVVA
jgi:hypothetical protein